ncbi:MAG: putative inorganic carbon transporter subunit DabA, partial [Candidatus Nanopelagicales bacterium]
MSSLRAATSALAVLALSCLALLLAVLLAGPVSATAASVQIAGGTLTLGIAVDGVRAVLLVLVAGVASVVAAYSGRNLAGQQRVARYAALLSTVVLGLALAVSGSSLPLLLLGWTAAGLAMAALVAHTGTDAAQAAARAVRRRLLVGDLALLLAVVVAGLGLGAWDVAALSSAASDSPVLAALVAALVVVAGAVRSALVPMHRWLPEVAEAPSPVSALLHAGFVNGVGLLALLLWPLVGASAVARGLALALGVLSVVVATMQMRVRPDVKGRLASSTSAQMGYLAVTFGLGLPAAALVHVLGHGMWKAGLFLGAGGAVERARAARAEHVSASRRARVAAVVLAVSTVVVAAAVPLASSSSLLSMPAYLLPVAVAALATAVGARSAAARPAAVVAVLAAGAAYVVGVRLLDHVLETAFGWSSPAWGAPGAALLAVLLGALLAVGAALALLDARARRGALPGLVRRVARTTLAGPRTASRVAVPAQRMPAAADSGTDVVREAVEVASRSVAPSWPLTSFVASNPLAGLEHLDFADALEVARSTWGARAGVDAALLRASLADGAADAGALGRVASSVSPGPDLMLAGGVRERAGLIAAALVADEPSEADIAWARSALGARSFAAARRCVVSSPAEAAADGRPELVALDERGRRLVSSYAALQYGAPAWPTAGAGIWASLRADADHLD